MKKKRISLLRGIAVCVNACLLYTSLPPAKYNAGSNVKNSLVASGCIINGTVETVSYTHLDVYKRQ